MRTVWLDLCFLTNLCADYLLCLLAARLCGVPLRRLRYALAALTGALYSVGALLFPSVLGTAAGKLGCAAVMCLCAFGLRRELPRLCAAFFMLSAALGGALWALALPGGGEIRVSFAVLVSAFLIAWGAIGALLRGSAARRERRTVSAELRFLGSSVRFRALVDTGNSLCDPISAKHVMVAAPEALRGVFRGFEGILALSDAAELLEAADAVPALRGAFRLIPFSAVGAKGLLPAFRPDLLLIDGAEERDVLVALSPSASGDGFEAII